MFENTDFVKTNAPFVAEYTEYAPAPMFRRNFSLGSFQKAEVSVCALGYGVFFINGKRITEDRFIAPVSDYNRTLWYNRCDVTALLREGENCIAVICGNGFFNESFATSWDHNKTAWRDNPKFILNLVVDGRTVLKSDTQWRVCPNPPITYNHLRSGEYFDSRLYDAEWDGVAYDDSAWEHAVADATPPKGALRECLCEPIREFETYKPVRVLRNAAGAHVFDIGQNISGDNWLEGGATTLWELLQGGTSLNHHMYSDFMAWIMKTLVGIRLDPEKPGFGAVKITPAFVAGLDHCAGYRDFPQGRLSVRWERQPEGSVQLEVDIPAGVDAAYGMQTLAAGKHAFTVKQPNLEETVL